MAEKEKWSTKLKNGAKNLKKHWKTPPDGYYVCYKEFLNLSLGQGSVSFVAILLSWTMITINVPMMISYFKVSTGFVFVSGIIASIIGLIRAPILSMMIDNTNSAKGKFKPFLPWSAVLTVLCFTFIPFIPQSWIEMPLFSFNIPSMPVFAVSASTIKVSVGTGLMFLLVQTGTFFHTLLTQCLTGLEQTISPVSQERANVTAFRGIISNIPGSIVNIVIPIVAGIAFKDTLNPMNNIELYRWAFPICGIGCIAFTFFAYFGVQERTVVHKHYVAKVSFADGFKQLFFNKYFWIIVIYNIAAGVRGNINMMLWICNYAIGGEKGAFVLAICQTVLNNAFVPGMLLGPVMIKKIGKKNAMLFSTIGFVVVAFAQLLCIHSPYLMLVCIFFQNFFAGFGYISMIMVPDVLDYQQWKTGKRLEGFWQNFNNFMLTFFGIFTTALVPLFLSFAGIGFGDNIDVALQDPTLMQNSFKSITCLGIFASVLCIIPFFFYDLSEKQHADYIRALKIRAVVNNFKNNDLTQQDVQDLQKIIAYAEENNDAFVYEELKQHDCIEEIVKTTVAAENE